MNRTQRLVLGIAGTLILVAVLFPPFTLRTAGGAVINLGYSFLLNPPRYQGPRWNGELPGSVDLSLLVVELGAILIVAGLAFVTLKSGVER